MKFYLKFLAILVTTISYGQDTIKISPIVPDHPGQSDGAFIVTAKKFQVETGFQFEKENASDENFLLPTVLLRYGVNEYFELRVNVQSPLYKSFGSTKYGLNPIVVGFKAKLTKENGIIPETAFIGNLGLPNAATTELKADYFAPEFKLSMEHTLSEVVALDYNLGMKWDGFSAAPTFTYVLNLGFSVTDDLDVFAEVYGFAPEKDIAYHSADFGLSYLISDNFAVDFSGGFGITSNAPNYFISAGFSFRI